MKRKRTLSYSASGKLFRGLLCMATFCAFAAGLVLSVLGIEEYGKEILEGGIHAQTDYYSSALYQRDIEDELQELLGSLRDAYVLNSDEFPEDTFSITDVGEGMIYTYDLKQIVTSENNGADIVIYDIHNLDGYKISETKLTYDLTDYKQALTYLNSSQVKNNYIYFGEKQFKNLFEADKGHLNVGHRFSRRFSEDAYFIFEYPDKEELFDETSVEEDAAGEAALFETVEDNAGRESSVTFNSDETVDFNISIEETGKDYSNFNLERDLVDYAVYDPENEIFYSPSDNYFGVMNSYLYDAEEVKEIITVNDYTVQTVDSLVLPLLKCTNWDFEEMHSMLASRYSKYLAPFWNLEQQEQNTQLLYDIRNSKFARTNAGKRSNVLSLQKVYLLNGERGNGKFSDGIKNAKECSFYSESIQEVFDAFPEDTVLYFGIHPDMGNDYSSIARHIDSYALWSQGIWYLIIGTVVAFILLIIQAVWLLRTTGKLAEDDEVIHLNRFDRLPADLWLLCYVGILGICLLMVMIAFRGLVTVMLDSSSRFLYVTFDAVSVVSVAALFFLLLTLSLARRVKAHTFWNGFYFKAVSEKFRKHIAAFCVRRKDSEKVLFLFIAYIGLEAFSILMIYFTDVLGFLLFIAVHIAAFIVILRFAKDIQIVSDGIAEIVEGNLEHRCIMKRKSSPMKGLVDGLNHIGDGLKAAVETSLKDERMKTELITNVSHDLKTPLTSIINYINLLKTEKMPTPEAEHYVEVLDGKAQRLKQLTEDLVEAAKANTGNIELERMPLAFDELMKQAIGEFEDKFAARGLTVITRYPEEPAIIMADGRRMFRIIENILQNACKYALEGTRIYADLWKSDGSVTFVLKNISAAPLNISPDELTERFTRGDSSRTTEGSGLGLAIAKDLTKLQGGTFELQLDGDLFKVVIIFPEHQETS